MKNHRNIMILHNLQMQFQCMQDLRAYPDDQKPVVLYRVGNLNPNTLTPRPGIDDNIYDVKKGLSFVTQKPTSGTYYVTTPEVINAMSGGKLKCILTPFGQTYHWSILPTNDVNGQILKGWASMRGPLNGAYPQHELTQI